MLFDASKAEAAATEQAGSTLKLSRAEAPDYGPTEQDITG
jgi:hypothetical protein